MNNPSRKKQSIHEKGVDIPVYLFSKTSEMNMELIDEKLRPQGNQIMTRQQENELKKHKGKEFVQLSSDMLKDSQTAIQDLSFTRRRRTRKEQHSSTIKKMLYDLKHGNKMSDDPEENARMVSEAKKIQRHEGNMAMMNDILDASAVQEQLHMANLGEKSFSSVSVYERNVQRKKDTEKTQQLLNRIRSRTRTTNLLSLDLEEKEVNEHSSNRNYLLNKTKERARKNFLEHVQREKIEDITIKEQIRHEKEMDKLRHQIRKLEKEAENSNAENKVLTGKVESYEEQVETYKYTIEMLRQKMAKVTEREIDNQQRLKVFEAYQPIFENLRDHFKFDNPKQVINRIMMLEKQQTTSYNQLMEVEQQRSNLEREINNIKQNHANEIRKTISNLKAKLKETAMERDNYQAAEISLRKEIRDCKAFKEKYLSLHSAAIDVWTTWFKDIETVGSRYSERLIEPDFSNSFQILESLKNMVITMNPSRAGELCIQYSQLANNYWLKYYSKEADIKGRPKIIFKRLGETMEQQAAKIKQLERQLHDIKREKKDIIAETSKLKRTNRAIESELNITRRDSISRPQSAKTSLFRPQSASARLQKKQFKSLRPSSGRTLKRKRPKSAITRSKTKSSPRNRPQSAAVRGSFFLTQSDN